MVHFKVPSCAHALCLLSFSTTKDLGNYTSAVQQIVIFILNYDAWLDINYFCLNISKLCYFKPKMSFSGVV